MFYDLKKFLKNIVISRLKMFGSKILYYKAVGQKHIVILYESFLIKIIEWNEVKS